MSLCWGDQQSPTISSLRTGSRSTDVVLMAEDQEEPTYVQHYRKKIAFLFSAMRHFAEEFRGWCVTYRQLSGKRI